MFAGTHLSNPITSDVTPSVAVSYGAARPVRNAFPSPGSSGSLYSGTVANCGKGPNIRNRNFDAGGIAMG